MKPLSSLVTGTHAMNFVQTACEKCGDFGCECVQTTLTTSAPPLDGKAWQLIKIEAQIGVDIYAYRTLENPCF